MFGVSSEKDVIITAWNLEISKSPEFLHVIIAAHRPYFKMLTSRTQGRTSTPPLQLLFLLAQHTLDSIHRQEIRIILSGPLMVLYAALFELLLSLTVRLRKVIDEGLVPCYDDFATRLAGDEIVLIGKVPMCLGVVIGIHSPLVVGTAVLRVQEHEN